MIYRWSEMYRHSFYSWRTHTNIIQHIAVLSFFGVLFGISRWGDSIMTDTVWSYTWIAFVGQHLRRHTTPWSKASAQECKGKHWTDLILLKLGQTVRWKVVFIDWQYLRKRSVPCSWIGRDLPGISVCSFLFFILMFFFSHKHMGFIISFNFLPFHQPPGQVCLTLSVAVFCF